jgi:hypothetical protein
VRVFVHGAIVAAPCAPLNRLRAVKVVDACSRSVVRSTLGTVRSTGAALSGWWVLKVEVWGTLSTVRLVVGGGSGWWVLKVEVWGTLSAVRLLADGRGGWWVLKVGPWRGDWGH